MFAYSSEEDKRWKQVVDFFKEKGEPGFYEEDLIGYPVAQVFPPCESPPVQKEGTLTEMIFKRLELSKNEQIDILSVSCSPVHKDLPRFKQLLVAALENNCQIRIALADPTSTYKNLHPTPNEFDQRFRQLTQLLTDIKSQRNETQGSLSVWTVDFPLHNSTYRFGDETIVVSHLFRQPSAQAPVFYLHHFHPLSKTYQDQFDQVIISELTTVLSLHPWHSQNSESELHSKLAEIETKINNKCSLCKITSTNSAL